MNDKEFDHHIKVAMRYPDEVLRQKAQEIIARASRQKDTNRIFISMSRPVFFGMSSVLLLVFAFGIYSQFSLRSDMRTLRTELDAVKLEGNSVVAMPSLERNPSGIDWNFRLRSANRISLDGFGGIAPPVSWDSIEAAFMSSVLFEGDEDNLFPLYRYKRDNFWSIRRRLLELRISELESRIQVLETKSKEQE